MFVRQSTYDKLEASRNMWRGIAEGLLEDLAQMRQEVNLSRMLMQRAAQIRGDLERQLQEGLSGEDLDRLIRLCHPDKHNGSEAATKATQMLLAMRSSRK